MANYTQLSRGSKGDDVKTLQQKLNENGYNLAVDGSFGAKTLAAVKDYQQKNKLAVDGIVGNNTWGALMQKTSAGNPTAGTSTSAGNGGFSFSPMPVETPSQWQTQLNDTINRILNREKFTYDVNGDALYQQYKDKYVTQGQMAMMDTMGQAQAMTGGYGNSYAQSVGQQTYQGYLQQLNDKVPELYQLALDQYNQEGQDLYNQYALLGDQVDRDHALYREEVEDWQNDRTFAYGKYSDDRYYEYQQERDRIQDEQWQKDFDEGKRQFDILHPKTTSSSNGVNLAPTTTQNAPGSVGAFNNAVQNRGVSTSNMSAMQGALGVAADGKWGPITQAAAMEKWGVSTPEEAYAAYQKVAPAYEFSGSYPDALKLLDKHGLKNFSARVMTPDEWARRKSSYQTTGQGGTEVTAYKTYQEYLKAFIIFAFESQ